MGGSIAVESTVGRGSTFAFTVSLAAGRPAGTGSLLADLAGLRILAVETTPRTGRSC
jgi:hypothetical protein